MNFTGSEISESHVGNEEDSSLLAYYAVYLQVGMA